MTLKQYHDNLSKDRNITIRTIDAFIIKNSINSCLSQRINDDDDDENYDNGYGTIELIIRFRSVSN